MLEWQLPSVHVPCEVEVASSLAVVKSVARVILCVSFPTYMHLQNATSGVSWSKVRTTSDADQIAFQTVRSIYTFLTVAGVQKLLGSLLSILTS